MRVLDTGFSKKVVALAASVALGAGSIVALAPTASAAPGDTAFFPTGAGAYGIVEDASGALWVTNRDGGSISKVALDGSTVTYQVGGEPAFIAVAEDGYLWFTDRTSNNIGKMSQEGQVERFANGSSEHAAGIAFGPDGNVWYTIPRAGRVGKMTMSGAVVDTYVTGDPALPIAYQRITAGPTGSNQMYLGGAIFANIGIITTQGDFRTASGNQSGLLAGDVATVNNQVWYTYANVDSAGLSRLVNDSGSVNLVDPALQVPLTLTQGLGNSMWVLQTEVANPGALNLVSRVTSDGNIVATYPVGRDSFALLQAADGNVWVTGGQSSNGITRVLTGVVPTSTAAPVLDPTSGLTAGASVSTSNGSWNYLPTSYSYQWQVCATSDAASCVDVPGSTGQSYTVATADVGKYLRVGVRATNLNGPSEPAYSGVVAAGEATPPPPPPNPNPNPQPAAGDTAVIGNGVTMTLDAPAKQKRSKRAWYEVDFSASDVQGTVVFEFRKGKRTKTKTVTIEDGIAEYRWKTPRKWRKGRTTVTATFIPAAGSPYTAAEVKDRVRIR